MSTENNDSFIYVNTFLLPERLDIIELLNPNKRMIQQYIPDIVYMSMCRLPLLFTIFHHRKIETEKNWGVYFISNRISKRQTGEVANVKVLPDKEWRIPDCKRQAIDEIRQLTEKKF